MVKESRNRTGDNENCCLEWARTALSFGARGGGAKQSVDGVRAERLVL
jgi:hypothetical protein